MQTSCVFALVIAIVVLNPLRAEPKGKVNAHDGASSSAPSGKKGGPPPWAPAHGYRAKYQYRYYPGHDVYFEPTKRIYFYLEAGKWKSGARLPDAIRIDHAHVDVGMNTDKPYQFHHDIKAAYPQATGKANARIPEEKTIPAAPAPGKAKEKKGQPPSIE